MMGKDMANRQKWFIGIVVVSTLLLLYVLTPVMQPFYIAAFLAYLSNPLVERLERWHVSRTAAVMLIFLLAIIGITLLAFILVPAITRQINMAISKIPDAIDWVQNAGLPWLTQYLRDDWQIDVGNLKATLLQGMQEHQATIAHLVKRLSQSGLGMLMWIINLVLIPVVTFYLLRDWHKMVPGIRRLLPRTIEPTVTYLTSTYNEILSAFLRGQLFIMFLLACYYSFGLWLVGLQTALLIGIFAGLLSIIPYLGFGVGIIAAALAAYIQFHAWMPVVYVLIVFGVGHVLEGMILTPILIGDKIGLHPVAVILAILAGGHFFGLLGALLAIPVAAGIMVLARFAVERYLASDIYTQHT